MSKISSLFKAGKNKEDAYYKAQWTQNHFNAYKAMYDDYVKAGYLPAGQSMSYEDFIYRYPYSSLKESGQAGWEGALKSDAEKYWKNYQKDTVSTTGEEAKAEIDTLAADIPEPYKYEETPEMSQVKSIINERLGIKPEFKPEDVSKWAEFINTATAPTTQKAVGDLGTSYNFMNPTGLGGGNQMKATRELLTDVASNNQATALSLGQADYKDKLTSYNDALTKAMGISDYETSMKKSTTDTAREDAWKILSAKLGITEDTNKNLLGLDTNTLGVLQSDVEAGKQYDMAQLIAELSKPKEVPWYQTALQGAATGLTSGIASYLPQLIASLLSKGKSGAGTTTSSGTGNSSYGNNVLSLSNQPGYIYGSR